MFLILVYEDYVFFIIFCLNLKIEINELFVLFIGYEIFKLCFIYMCWIVINFSFFLVLYFFFGRFFYIFMIVLVIFLVM